MTNRISSKYAAAAAIVLTTVAATPQLAMSSTCTDPVMVNDTDNPSHVSFMGSEISRSAMNALWDLVAPSPPGPHHFIGQLVASDQDWLGTCGYPGVGITSGSGWNADSKNVTFWFWASGVDVEQARTSIAVHIGAVEQSTTTLAPETTTTTTTVAEATPQALSTFDSSREDKVAIATISTITTTTTSTTLPAPTVQSATPVSAMSVAVPGSTRIVKPKSKPKAAVKVKRKLKPKKVKWTRKQVTRSVTNVK